LTEQERLNIPAINCNPPSLPERIDLINALWDSVDQKVTPLTEAQTAEIDRRFAIPGDHIDHRSGAATFVAQLRARYCP
jgi:putative addiction module component (TIGR02574 family)